MAQNDWNDWVKLAVEIRRYHYVKMDRFYLKYNFWEEHRLSAKTNLFKKKLN